MSRNQYQNSESLLRIVEFGKSIRYYVIALTFTLISSLVSIIASLFVYVMGGIIFFAILSLLGTIIGLIITFVLSIYYLVKLNNLKNTTGSTIINQIFLLEIMLIVVNVLISLFVPTFAAEGTIGALVESYIKNIPALIFTIFIAINYSKWMDELANLGRDPQIIQELQNKANLYKIGAFVACIPIIGFIGTIINLIALFNIGKNLEYFAFKKEMFSQRVQIYGSVNNQSNVDTLTYPIEQQNSMQYPRVQNDYENLENNSQNQNSNIPTFPTNCPNCKIVLESHEFIFCPRCGFQVRR